jgi:hypothetical protein
MPSMLMEVSGSGRMAGHLVLTTLGKIVELLATVDI